jgi:hypothetical protein
MKLIVAGAAALSLLLCSANKDAHAEEVVVGHLETHDDIATNWLYLHCDRQGPKLACDAFQTLIYHEIEPSQREAEITKFVQGNPVASFRNEMGETCAHTAEMAEIAMKAVNTGKGLDGRSVNPDAAKQGLAMFSAMDAACRDSSVASVQKLAEVMADGKLKSCKVHNDWSKMTFSWNAPTNAWVSQEGPMGPCGFINIDTLQKDTSTMAGFWTFTEKKIPTRPDGGEFRPGLSCKQFPETTFRYTWRSEAEYLDCLTIENTMN